MELSDIRKVMLSAAGTADVVVVDILLHLFLGPAVDPCLRLNALFCHIVLDQLIGAETLLTCLTVHKGVGEASQMAGSHPCLGVH